MVNFACAIDCLLLAMRHFTSAALHIGHDRLQLARSLHLETVMSMLTDRYSKLSGSVDYSLQALWSASCATVHFLLFTFPWFSA